ncbi:hypothetical protein [Streptomyces antibioticus]|uniref:hypothetical protein n=1 Tax=Streptomyces antibioticus TaxID=1890 RepID=UPI003F46F020
MTEAITRRAYLAAAIQREPGPVSTRRAEQLLAASPWPTSGRNTARKDLRALAARGLLRPGLDGGRRVYHPTSSKDSMSTRALPHDPYITAVGDALTAAGLELTDYCWTDDGETRGMYCYLNAVITLDPSGTVGVFAEDIPAGTAWPHGLLLIWEWHTGIEAELGEPEKGPIWQFAELKADGSSNYPTDLPVYGYASPAAVVEAARKVISREIGAGHFFNGGWAAWDGGIIGDSWERADELDAACETWGASEGSE